MKDEFANRTLSLIPYPSSFLPVVPDGVEPSFPGCGPSVVAVGPRDHCEWSHRESHPDFRVADPASSCWTMTPKRKPWESNPQTARCRRLPSKQVPQPVGWLPYSSCQGYSHARKAEVVGLEPTSGCSPPPVFKTGSSSGRMTSVFELRRLESNQHEDVQSVSSCR